MIDMDPIEWNKIVESLMVISIVTSFTWLFGGVSWIFLTTLKNRRDINEIFPVLRRIDKRTNIIISKLQFEDTNSHRGMK